MMNHNDFLQIIITGIHSPLQLLRVEGIEYLNSPYEFQLSLVADDPDILKQLQLGQSVSFAINHEGTEPQWFNAVIESVSDPAEKDPVLLTVVPRFSTLKYSLRNQAYVNQTVLEILKTVCREHDIKSDFRVLSGNFKIIPYCVQYQESDFHFLSRLCETHGIYYYFQHSQTDHTMVFCNNIFPDLKYAPMLCHRNAQGGDTPHLYSWQRKIMTRIPKMQSQSFNMDSPDQPNTAEMQSRQSQPKLPITRNTNSSHDEAGFYSSTGQDDLADRLQRQQQSELVKTLEIRSAGNYPNLMSGMQVSVISETDPQINGDYYLSEIRHKATAAIRLSQQDNTESEQSRHAYQNQLKLIPQSIAFVPPLIHQATQIAGVIPAVVTGPDGTEVYCNTHAAVKVQPEWDSGHSYDESGSDWVRTVQAWAGKGFGSQFVPRSGQQILLTFQQGWHHKPTVLRGIYNYNEAPVFNSQHQSGYKTHTLNGENDEGHVLRFDDTPGREQVYLKSQKDKEVMVNGQRERTVKNNLTVQLEKGRSDHKVEGDLIIHANECLQLHAGSSAIILDKNGVTVQADFIELVQG